MIRWLKNLFIKPTPGAWKQELQIEARRSVERATSQLNLLAETDYEDYQTKCSQAVDNPCAVLQRAIESEEPVKLPGMREAARIEIAQARLYEARVNDFGQPMPKKLREKGEQPYRISVVRSAADFKQKLSESKTAQDNVILAAPKIREAKRQALQTALKENFVDNGGTIDSITTQYDRSQFTEFAPLFGNQFYKQQYFHDMLQTFALAYEAWNHNPLAKRIVNHLCNYVVGRGVKIETRNEDAQNAWEEFAEEIGLLTKARDWFREKVIYGEIFLNKANWQLLDPSSIWEVIHVPEDVDAVLYYYQAFLSDFQMFTGYPVPGAPGVEKTPVVRFTINQIPADQIIHKKTECVSNEKRGRSKLFPILGWLKRYKDLMTAEVIKSQLQASFIWDDLVVGDDADVRAHAQQYNGMPVAGSVFAHNERVTRTPVKVATDSSASGRANLGDTIIAFIATAMGIPKEHLNVMGSSVRASALVSSEPFTKVIEELQTEFEELLHEIAAIELPRRGVAYNREEIEFVFPSVTKDTTSETIQNLMIGEQAGYISQRRAAGMYAAEMNITNYDFEIEQKQITDDKNSGLDQQGPPPPTAAKMGNGSGGDDDMSGGSDIHGDGKMDVQDSLMTL